MSRNGDAAIPPLEWAVAALGLLCTLALLAYLVIEGVRGDGRPAAVSVTLDSIVRQDGGWLAAVTARNDGDRTAAEVTIEGDAGGVRSTVTLDYLPPRSTRSAGLSFPSDPTGRLTLRATGFRDP